MAKTGVRNEQAMPTEGHFLTKEEAIEVVGGVWSPGACGRPSISALRTVMAEAEKPWETGVRRQDRAVAGTPTW